MTYLTYSVFIWLIIFASSFSDFPPEWSSGRWHPADSAGTEPGPQGGRSDGVYWRRAV